MNDTRVQSFMAQLQPVLRAELSPDTAGSKALALALLAAQAETELGNRPADMQTREALLRDIHLLPAFIVQQEGLGTTYSLPKLVRRFVHGERMRAVPSPPRPDAAEAARRHARLRELQSFEKVYAPFDGVITARTVDIGQLIDQGAAKELFQLQAIQTLRVYSNLPQSYSQSIKRGMKVDLTFPEHVGKTYQGTLVRTADAIDPASRTLLVEIDVDNRDGQLLPGSLAQVRFKTPPAGPVFIVPSAALIFRRNGLQVSTVENGNTARLVAVVMGEDDGATAQIVGGLKAGDLVIQDPPDSLIDGEKVTVVSPGNASNTGGK